MQQGNSFLSEVWTGIRSNPLECVVNVLLLGCAMAAAGAALFVIYACAGY